MAVFRLQIGVCGSQILLPPHLKDVSLDVDGLAGQGDGALLVWLHQDAERIQGELQLGANPDENGATLKSQKRKENNYVRSFKHIKERKKILCSSLFFALREKKPSMFVVLCRFITLFIAIA